APAHEVEIQGAIAEVHRTSHIGGHRFAATCIVYPQGIWYGELRPEDASRLVEEHLLNERLLPDHYRGRLGTSTCQQVAEAEAARILIGTYPEYESLSVEVQKDEAGREASAVARAVVPGPIGYMTVRAEWTLSCPLIWWTADDEPLFIAER
ncbi:MAG: sucrase/ferredoxin-like domain-containing protein, partial [Ardenticatenaceae bacterium]